MLFPLFCAIFAGMNVNEIKDQKIAVLLSGGVDSSVVVYELAQLGLQPDCFYIKIGPEEDEEWDCSSEEDLEMASAVAARFGCRLEVVDCHEAYWQQVTRYTMEKVKAGFTPNPDVMCNRMIKFGAFNEKRGHAYDLIATGHYARKEVRDGVHYLLRGADGNKDQSYFLYRLQPYQLQKALFPLGHLEKPEVRRLAVEFGLPTAAKKDSTGICFIGERPFREFLQKYLPTHNGNMVTPEGKIVGEHVGLTFYTIGQRKGLGIGGAGEPWFVAGKNLPKNELLVVQGHDHELLYTRSLQMNQLSWTLPEKPREGRYTCKTRYRMTDAACTLRYLSDDTAELQFDEPQWAVTHGQSAVLYDGEICLGGGIITATDKPLILL